MVDTDAAWLAERTRIVESIYRIAYHNDQNDWDNFAEGFTDPVEIDFSGAPYGGDRSHLVPRDKWIAAASSPSRIRRTQHHESVYWVEINGNEATAVTYVIARHLLDGPDGTQCALDEGGYYTHTLLKYEGKWRVRRLKYSQLWAHGDPQAERMIKEDGLSQGWADLYQGKVDLPAR
jgi:SnoaL-like domain